MVIGCGAYEEISITKGRMGRVDVGFGVGELIGTDWDDGVFGEVERVEV